MGVNEYTILFEDESVILANKLAPIPVQPEKTGDESLQDMLVRAETEKAGKAPDFLEAVHRIDRRASGAVLFAKTQAAAAALSEALRSGKIGKTYLAVVDTEPTPPSGTLEGDIAWDARNSKARVRGVSAGKAQAKEGKAALEYKKASLSYRVAAKSERYVLLEIKLETGRPHQIRAQLAAIGLPVRGDLKYGARRSAKNGMIMLHSFRVEFSHPVSGMRLSFCAPPPGTDNLWSAFGDATGAGTPADAGPSAQAEAAPGA